MSSVFVYDSTKKDSLSKVRGVGRYLQILKENLPQNAIFANNIRQIPADSIFINPFFNFLQYPLTLRRIAKKQIAVIHDLIPLKYPKHFPAGVRGKLNIFLNKQALKYYDLIITDSEASKKDIMKILGIEENKVKVIYPTLPKIFSEISKWKMGIETGQENRNKKLIKNQTSEIQLLNSLPNLSSNFCLYVGDATWNKNLVKLVKAIKIINITCVFAGRVFSNQSSVFSKKTDNYFHPWQKEFKEFLHLTNNDKRFIFLGYVSDEDLIQLYQRASCNILVSRDEGFGFSYLEAASQNCPSILSDIPVLREISNSWGAMFTKPNDANDIANAIGEVYFNKDLRNKLGKKAKERIKYFNPKKFVNEFSKILNL